MHYRNIWSYLSFSFSFLACQSLLGSIVAVLSAMSDLPEKTIVVASEFILANLFLFVCVLRRMIRLWRLHFAVLKQLTQSTVGAGKDTSTFDHAVSISTPKDRLLFVSAVKENGTREKFQSRSSEAFRKYFDLCEQHNRRCEYRQIL